MPTRLAALLSVCLALALGGCATLDEAYGRPDSQDWTYFYGTPEAVVGAIQGTFLLSGNRIDQRFAKGNEGREISLLDGIGIESIRKTGAGLVVVITTRRGSADVTEILVQGTEVEDFGARAQIYTQSAPLPRWLEMEITGRI